MVRARPLASHEIPVGPVATPDNGLHDLGMERGVEGVQTFRAMIDIETVMARVRHLAPAPVRKGACQPRNTLSVGWVQKRSRHGQRRVQGQGCRCPEQVRPLAQGVKGYESPHA